MVSSGFERLLGTRRYSQELCGFWGVKPEACGKGFGERQEIGILT